MSEITFMEACENIKFMAISGLTEPIQGESSHITCYVTAGFFVDVVDVLLEEVSSYDLTVTEELNTFTDKFCDSKLYAEVINRFLLYLEKLETE